MAKGNTLVLPLLDNSNLSFLWNLASHGAAIISGGAKTAEDKSWCAFAHLVLASWLLTYVV